MIGHNLGIGGNLYIDTASKYDGVGSCFEINAATLHHSGDALAHKKLAQQDPQLVADHVLAVKAKAQTTEQAERKAKALEWIRKQRAKEKELGRDDRGRSAR